MLVLFYLNYSVETVWHFVALSAPKAAGKEQADPCIMPVGALEHPENTVVDVGKEDTLRWGNEKVRVLFTHGCNTPCKKKFQVVENGRHFVHKKQVFQFVHALSPLKIVARPRQHVVQTRPGIFGCGRQTLT